MRVLDLFSGIGGFSLGLERAGMETVAFCEIEPFCQEVLRKHWPGVPIHEDIRELKGDAIGPVDLICGGYPCQPFSTAGKRGGASDDRHLWPEYLRLIRELRPSWVIGENVAGHISMGLDQVLADLEGEGYAWETFVIPACAVDAPHRRDRVWIVARASSDRDDRRSITSDSDFQGLEVGQGQDASRTRQDSRPKSGRGARWEPEPGVGRVAHGIPRRVDRLRALGNAVVPQIPEILGRAIMEIERQNLAP